jgi:hypothetical protein
MTNSFNEDDITHIELTATQPSNQLGVQTIDSFEEREALPHEKAMLINRGWRAFKTDQLRVLNFDQAFMGVDYYTPMDKSTKLTGS